MQITKMTLKASIPRITCLFNQCKIIHFLSQSLQGSLRILAIFVFKLNKVLIIKSIRPYGKRYSIYCNYFA